MNDSTSIPAPLISTGQPDMEAPDVTSEWSDHSLNLLGIPAFTKEQKDAWAARFDGLPEEDFSLVFWEDWCKDKGHDLLPTKKTVDQYARDFAYPNQDNWNKRASLDPDIEPTNAVELFLIPLKRLRKRMMVNIITATTTNTTTNSNSNSNSRPASRSVSSSSLASLLSSLPPLPVSAATSLNGSVSTSTTVTTPTISWSSPSHPRLCSPYSSLDLPLPTLRTGSDATTLIESIWAPTQIEDWDVERFFLEEEITTTIDLQQHKVHQPIQEEQQPLPNPLQVQKFLKLEEQQQQSSLQKQKQLSRQEERQQQQQQQQRQQQRQERQQPKQQEQQYQPKLPEPQQSKQVGKNQRATYPEHEQAQQQDQGRSQTEKPQHKIHQREHLSLQLQPHDERQQQHEQHDQRQHEQHNQRQQQPSGPESPTQYWSAPSTPESPTVPIQSLISIPVTDVHLPPVSAPNVDAPSWDPATVALLAVMGPFSLSALSMSSPTLVVPPLQSNAVSLLPVATSVGIPEDTPKDRRKRSSAITEEDDNAGRRYKGKNQDEGDIKRLRMLPPSPPLPSPPMPTRVPDASAGARMQQPSAPTTPSSFSSATHAGPLMQRPSTPETPSRLLLTMADLDLLREDTPCSPTRSPPGNSTDPRSTPVPNTITTSAASTSTEVFGSMRPPLTRMLTPVLPLHVGQRDQDRDSNMSLTAASSLGWTKNPLNPGLYHARSLDQGLWLPSEPSPCITSSAQATSQPPNTLALSSLLQISRQSKTVASSPPISKIKLSTTSTKTTTPGTDGLTHMEKSTQSPTDNQSETEALQGPPIPPGTMMKQ